MDWRYTVSLDDVAFQAALAGMRDRARNLRPALEAIGDMLMTSTSMRFEQQHGPDGAAWTPWAASTARQRAKEGRTQILEWGGKGSQHLRASITRRMSSSEVTIGTAVPYARIQQEGGTITRYAQSREVLRRFVQRKTKNGTVRELLPGFARRSKANFASWHAVPEHVITIPARPFLGINDADRAAGAAILNRYLRGAQ